MEITVVSMCFMVILLASGIAGDQLRDENRILKQLLRKAILNNSLKGGNFVGGSEGDWRSHPYVVTIESNNKILGGGAIISDNSILTSKDTVASVNAGDLIVRAVDTTIKGVGGIIVQDEERSGGLAVLKLTSKFVFNQPTVSPIELRKDIVPEHLNCTVMGLQESSSTDFHIKYANVPITHNAECESAWAKELDVGYLCTGSYDTYTELCYPNMGDPLICDGILTGIATQNNLCDEEMFPGIYANVAHHNDWIVEEMTKEPPTTTTVEPPTGTTPSSATSNRQNHFVLAALVSAVLGVLSCRTYS